MKGLEATPPFGCEKFPFVLQAMIPFLLIYVSFFLLHFLSSVFFGVEYFFQLVVLTGWQAGWHFEEQEISLFLHDAKVLLRLHVGGNCEFNGTLPSLLRQSVRAEAAAAAGVGRVGSFGLFLGRRREKQPFAVTYFGSFPAFCLFYRFTTLFFPVVQPPNLPNRKWGRTRRKR